MPSPSLHRNQSNADTDASKTDARVELYHEHRKQAWQDIQASTDQFDKSLLTLSSGALALSMAFIKDLVPLKCASGVYWLYISWTCFVLCIVVTVFSFPMSVKAQKKQLEYLREFYIEGRADYFDKQSRWSRAINWCSILGGASFLIAIISTMIFVLRNVRRICQ